MKGFHQLHQRFLILAVAAALGAQDAAAQLQIAAPASASVGQTIFITVMAGPSVQNAFVMTESPLPEVQATGNPNQFSMAIPPKFTPGVYHLTAVGAASGADLESDPFAIAIERLDDPVQIRVEPTNLTFRAAGDQIPLRVVGTYADGTQTTLTASGRTRYSSADSSVATVSASGVVTAVGPGKTRIMTATPAASFTVQVQVLAPPSTTLSLHNGRFQVTVTYATASASGQGTPVQLTPDTGYFWFFTAANVEMVLKVLDGCSLGGHYWVFAGGLTNVQTQIVVTDTQANQSKTYKTPQGPAFTPIQDTKAFATCP